MHFEWDDDKNLQNIAKHGLSFEDASRIFRGFTLDLLDDRFDYGELREVSIGMIDGLAVVTVSIQAVMEFAGLSPHDQRQERKGADMNKRYEEPMTLEQLARLPDDQIDTSDIPELDEAWFAQAKLTPPRTKPNVSLRVPPEVVEYFKAKNPKGYTARMAAVLVAYVQAHRSTSAQE